MNQPQEVEKDFTFMSSSMSSPRGLRGSTRGSAYRGGESSSKNSTAPSSSSLSSSSFPTAVVGVVVFVAFFVLLVTAAAWRKRRQRRQLQRQARVAQRERQKQNDMYIQHVCTQCGLTTCRLTTTSHDQSAMVSIQPTNGKAGGAAFLTVLPSVNSLSEIDTATMTTTGTPTTSPLDGKTMTSENEHANDDDIGQCCAICLEAYKPGQEVTWSPESYCQEHCDEMQFLPQDKEVEKVLGESFTFATTAASQNREEDRKGSSAGPEQFTLSPSEIEADYNNDATSSSCPHMFHTSCFLQYAEAAIASHKVDTTQGILCPLCRQLFVKPPPSSESNNHSEKPINNNTSTTRDPDDTARITTTTTNTDNEQQQE